MPVKDNYPSTKWRLIHTSAGHGAWNMAADEAILEAVGSGDSPPTLRLYAWSPPCLSLGYAQPYSDANLEGLSANGWELVRRPTGGRAILHTDELTYAVIGPPDEPRLAGGVLESYRRLSRALLEALQNLGIPAQALQKSGVPDGDGSRNPVCFENPSNYEITVQGKKLIGSAQARRREGVLQHGSLPLSGDLARITQALRFADEQARQQAVERLLARATTVELISGQPLKWEDAAEAFAQAFSQCLNLQFDRGSLTDRENERATELVDLKYAHPSWTERV
jgi:lipoate-protein ligase A